MDSNTVLLNIKRWSAWAPGLMGLPDWSAWASGKKQISQSGSPNVNFVESLTRRRLNLLNRMAIKAADSCMTGEKSRPLTVFCSRFGEFSRAIEILNNLANNEAVSPTTFSLSVHNTSSSLYSIICSDNLYSSALAGNEATFESGFIECWSLLKEQQVSRGDDKATVLLVYCEELLPDIFLKSGQLAENENVAVAFLMRLPQEKEDYSMGNIKLSWQTNLETSRTTLVQNSSSVLRLLKLLLIGGSPVTSNFERLLWTWSCKGPLIDKAVLEANGIYT